MNASAALSGTPASFSASQTARVATPWFCVTAAISATLILAGIIWDISWHSAIGRDTFWTPAHICIHLGGTLGGFVCGWLVLRTTFGPDTAGRLAGVKLWGFRGPLGAWVTIWGALAMLTSAPFDNWWHDAYGLDVKILSPPHSILAAGMYFQVAGGLLLILGVQNRQSTGGAAPGRWLFVYAAAILLCLAAIMCTEEVLPQRQRTGLFYQIGCAVFPFFLVPMARAAKVPWPATTIAAIYMGLTCAAVWILPLFPATPMLAPIYNPVTHMVPPMFPLLLVVPALGIDLVLRLFRHRSGWKWDLLVAFLTSVVFVALFVTVQWHFAAFLISPEANNAFFAGNRFFTFADRPSPAWNRFWQLAEDPVNRTSLTWAWLLALGSCTAGVFLGNWMKRVRR